MPVPTVGMFQHPITFSASRIGLGAMLNTPLNGPIHLQDDEDCGENRDRFKCQRHDHSGVGWLGEKTKADRCDGQPPDQEHQERQWKAILLHLAEQQPFGLPQANGHGDDRGFDGGLPVIRRKMFHLGHNSFGMVSRSKIGPTGCLAWPDAVETSHPN